MTYFDTGSYLISEYQRPIDKISRKDFARIGLGICYDVRFPEMAAIAARQGEGTFIDIFTAPSDF